MRMGTWCRIRLSSRKCRGFSRAVTCRTGATGKLLQPLVPAAWPRTKLRNFLRTKVCDGEVLKGADGSLDHRGHREHPQRNSRKCGTVAPVCPCEPLCPLCLSPCSLLPRTSA